MPITSYAQIKERLAFNAEVRARADETLKAKAEARRARWRELYHTRFRDSHLTHAKQWRAAHADAIKYARVLGVGVPQARAILATSQHQ